MTELSSRTEEDIELLAFVRCTTVSTVCNTERVHNMNLCRTANNVNQFSKNVEHVSRIKQAYLFWFYRPGK